MRSKWEGRIEPLCFFNAFKLLPLK